ncbi:MAG: hypothetical protein JNM34_12765, partial [Chthonomonadaceae bacterium]|nr:hypothetical protein [Chthonomonadaceae bacterium]
ACDIRHLGQSLRDFGLIRQKLADMATLYFVAEAALYRTGDLIDSAFHANDGSIDGNRKAAEEFAVECSAVKVFSTECESRIVDDALQIYGGYGFTEEFPIARVYRDARVSRIYEGTNEINRLFIADRLYRKLRDGAITMCPDSFVSELCAKAYSKYESGQVVLGALSDLTILSYVEQSARTRARHGGLAAAAHGRFVNWANCQAAQAYQTITGEAVQIPASNLGHVDDLAEALLTTRRPVSF